jgi:hypothetical protein
VNCDRIFNVNMLRLPNARNILKIGLRTKLWKSSSRGLYEIFDIIKEH